MRRKNKNQDIPSIETWQQYFPAGISPQTGYPPGMYYWPGQYANYSPVCRPRTLHAYPPGMAQCIPMLSYMPAATTCSPNGQDCPPASLPCDPTPCTPRRTVPCNPYLPYKPKG